MQYCSKSLVESNFFIRFWRESLLAPKSNEQNSLQGTKSTMLPASSTFVLHFTLRNDDILDKICSLNVIEHEEEFCDTSDFKLMNASYWYKIVSLGKENKKESLKKAIFERNDLTSVDETKDRHKVFTSLGIEQSELKPYTKFTVRRCYIQKPDVYMDSCKFGDVFYWVYTCKGTSVEEITKLMQGHFDMGDVVQPVPSKVVVYLLHEKLELVSCQGYIDHFRDHRQWLFRNGDPLKSLRKCGRKEEVQQWAGNLYGGRFKDQFYQVLHSLEVETSEQIYSIPLLHFVEKGKVPGLVLYFNLHLWEPRERYSKEDLIAKVKQTPDLVNILHEEELELLLRYQEAIGDKELVNEIGDQQGFVVMMKNRFIDWQIENNIPLVLP